MLMALPPVIVCQSVILYSRNWLAGRRWLGQFLPSWASRSCSSYNSYRTLYEKLSQTQSLEDPSHYYPAPHLERTLAGICGPAHFGYLPARFPVSILSGVGPLPTRRNLFRIQLVVPGLRHRYLVLRKRIYCTMDQKPKTGHVIFLDMKLYCRVPEGLGKLDIVSLLCKTFES